MSLYRVGTVWVMGGMVGGDNDGTIYIYIKSKNINCAVS